MNHRFFRSLLALSAVIAFLPGCSNRLGPYRDLLVGVPAKTAPTSRAGDVTVTYLGVNGYLLRCGGTSLLVDPYFSRLSPKEIILNAPVESSSGAIAFAEAEGAIPSEIDGYLVTHCHFDHLFDVPAMQKERGGKVIVSKTGVYLCAASGVPSPQLITAVTGGVHRIGNATITVLSAHHDKVLGKIPYRGDYDAPLKEKPVRPKDWVLGTPQAFLIEMGGARIYVESGGVSGAPPGIRNVDLAIVGAAVGNTERYIEAVDTLNPRYVLPSHQDNFLNPLRSGFHFSVLSNFPEIAAAGKYGNLPGELILMDYFHRWTLPMDTPSVRPEKSLTSLDKLGKWLKSLFASP